MRVRQSLGCLALAAVLSLTGACGGGGDDDAPGSVGTDSGDDSSFSTEITVTFDLEGEETVKGTVVDKVAPTVNGKNPETCAEYAKGSTKESGKTYFVLPAQLGGDINGKNVATQVLVKDYTGPGTYTEEKLTAEGVSFGVRVGQRPYVRQGSDSGSIVTVKPDGSGNFYFEKLAFSTGATVSPGISGMVEWTCKDK